MLIKVSTLEGKTMLILSSYLFQLKINGFSTDAIPRRRHRQRAEAPICPPIQRRSWLGRERGSPRAYLSGWLTRPDTHTMVPSATDILVTVSGSRQTRRYPSETMLPDEEVMHRCDATDTRAHSCLMPGDDAAVRLRILGSRARGRGAQRRQRRG